MPLYEYECEACGHRAEVLQRVGAPPIGACESCGGKMKRLLSAPAFQFKGSGWYVTDYAKKSSPGAGAGEAQGSKESATPTASASSEVKSSGKDKASTQSSAKKTPASD
jgi:putative FmdB family regulatory protein